MAWFKYRQNNSGGSFIVRPDQGIGPRVWIEAPNAASADALAEGKGIYFDGCADGRDCRCCGDRWDSACEDDAEQNPELSPEYDFNWHDEVYLHHADGRIEAVKKS